jgi:hypothetical protein
MIKIIVWIFAGIGVFISFLGAAGILASEATTGGGHIFPLPGLILIEWASIGLLAFIFAIAVFNPQYQHLERGIWMMTGALLPLVVLGALSIGPLVLAAAICFLLASISVSLHTGTQLVPKLGYLLIGAIGNLIIVLVLITINSLLSTTL